LGDEAIYRSVNLILNNEFLFVIVRLDRTIQKVSGFPEQVGE
jgi:hypothetical protein